MIQQYKEIKAQNQDKILLFRVGDFYEMFFEDAKIGARELEITLTSRDKEIPLAGFPYHALNSYLGKLIDRGYKVAICEQVEDPKLAKGIVKREVVQVITPGTVTESSLLDEKSNNYLVAVYLTKGGIGLAVVDVSTGQFNITQAQGREAGKVLIDELARLQPTEILVNESAKQDKNLQKALQRIQQRVLLNECQEQDFKPKNAAQTLLKQFGETNLNYLLDNKLQYALSAAGTVITYLRSTQQKELTHLQKPVYYDPQGFMVLDAATRRNLELTRTIREESKHGSLLWVLDKTRTAIGARLLKRWLEQPLLEPAAIEQRLDAVEEFYNNFSLSEQLSALLDRVYDLERLLGRVHNENANARDLIALCSTLAVLPEIGQLLLTGGSCMQKFAARLPQLEKLTFYLQNALADDPPLTLREGGLIRDGFNAELDQLRRITTDGRSNILDIEQREKERTGIKSLKVGYNKVFGYYLEVTRTNVHLVPDNYIRKQTLANAERYITQELKEYENAVLGAEEKITALEYELFLAVREKVASYTQEIQVAAAVVAELDVYLSLAKTARINRYVRPQIDLSTRIKIIEGRHPVVEKVMQDELFVPNDTLLGESRQVLLITGPNMAGKSTYMRQVALIVLMAQIGSFVPARQASIGLVDRIFTRIGAADDLVGGQSTFMVEMSEVANILSSATERSLVILDEVGRGTSTFDGISIARAVVEYLCNRIKARTLFATHYHELVELAATFPMVQNMTTAVKERGEDIIFLHKLVHGTADHSYGIQVARLAGLPKIVLNRAKEILQSLEEPLAAERQAAPAVENQQLSLFAPDPEVSNELNKIAQTDLMTTTPIEAMQLLYALQQALKGEKNDG